MSGRAEGGTGSYPRQSVAEETTSLRKRKSQAKQTHLPARAGCTQEQKAWVRSSAVVSGRREQVGMK